MSIADICKIKDCNRIGSFDKNRGNYYLKKGYCNKHYLRQYRGKNIAAKTTHDIRPAIIEENIAKIPLGIDAKDGYAIVDANKASLSKQNFHKTRGGYAAYGRSKYLHHVIAGVPPKGYFVDHINRDKLDNRLSNLRIVSIKQSSYNTAPLPSARSRYKGVWFNKPNRKWQADIKVDGEKIYLGRYDIEEDAAKAYDRAAKEYWGEYAYLNFPD